MANSRRRVRVRALVHQKSVESNTTVSGHAVSACALRMTGAQASTHSATICPALS